MLVTSAAIERLVSNTRPRYMRQSHKTVLPAASSRLSDMLMNAEASDEAPGRPSHHHGACIHENCFISECKLQI